MWSADRYRAGTALALACALLAGACQVRPLYAPTPQGTELEADLSSISIDPASGRTGQVLRNELIFLLNGGGQPGSQYRLTLDVKLSRGKIIVRQIGGEPQARLLNLRAAYKLFRQGETTPILQGAATRQATHEWYNQRFANDRAELDAEARAAREVAEEIRTRLAAFFATGQRAVTQGSPELDRLDGEKAIPDIGEDTIDTSGDFGGDSGAGGILD